MRQELQFESIGKEKFALLILTLLTRHSCAGLSSTDVPAHLLIIVLLLLLLLLLLSLLLLSLLLLLGS